jgi:hypothetical protein
MLTLNFQILKSLMGLIFFCGTVNFLLKTVSSYVVRNYTRHLQAIFNPFRV